MTFGESGKCHDYVAVPAVLGESVSAFQFSDLRKVTGNLASSCTTLPAEADFSQFTSTDYSKIPYTADQGIFQTKQGIPERKHGPFLREQAGGSEDRAVVTLGWL